MHSFLARVISSFLEIAAIISFEMEQICGDIPLFLVIFEVFHLFEIWEIVRLYKTNCLDFNKNLIYFISTTK